MFVQVPFTHQHTDEWKPCKQYPWVETSRVGNIRWYRCTGCDYMNNVLYHTRMHHERIHVRGGRPHRCRRAFPDGFNGTAMAATQGLLIPVPMLPAAEPMPQPGLDGKEVAMLPVGLVEPERATTTSSSSMTTSPQTMEEEEEAHLPRGHNQQPIPWGPFSDFEGLETFKDDEGTVWYRCCACDYVKDKLYHAKKHYERIHLKGGNPMHGKRAYPSLVKTGGGLLRKKRSCPGKVSALGAGKAAQKKKEEDFVHWTSFFDYSKEKEEEQQIDGLGWPCDGEATLVSSMEKGPVSVVCMSSSASIAKALEEVKTSKAALFKFGDHHEEGSELHSRFATIGHGIEFSTTCMDQWLSD